MSVRGNLLARLVTLLALSPSLVAADRAPTPGAYCPLPEAGEVPACLDPAQEAYGEFFEAVEGGELDDGSLAPVEAAVEGGAAAEHAYLALSSLAYGYYRLAVRAARDDAADPALIERLARWNELLANAYATSPEDVAYRAAVRQAAEEIHARAPVALPCRDGAGAAVACTSTESVLRGFHAASDEVGVRGALERLMRRIFGGEAP